MISGMNKYPGWVNSSNKKKQEEPWWVTQCLDFGRDNDDAEGRCCLEKLIVKLLRVKKKVSKTLNSEREMRRETESVYRDILKTIKINSPPASCKSDHKPKSILRKTSAFSPFNHEYDRQTHQFYQQQLYYK